MKIALVFCFSLFFLTGCPPSDTTDCEKIMVCDEDTEMLCDKNDSGCGEDCHYYVVEHCYERCR